MSASISLLCLVVLLQSSARSALVMCCVMLASEGCICLALALPSGQIECKNITIIPQKYTVANSVHEFGIEGMPVGGASCSNPLHEVPDVQTDLCVLPQTEQVPERRGPTAIMVDVETYQTSLIV